MITNGRLAKTYSIVPDRNLLIQTRTMADPDFVANHHPVAMSEIQPRPDNCRGMNLCA